MKKIYTFLFMMMALCATAVAQDEAVTIEVNNRTGDWTAANSNKTWASRWESYGSPSLIIEHTNASGGHNNNMAYYAPNKTDIQFYNSLGGSTTSENYHLRATDGYQIAEVSFDFVCANDQGVSITFPDDEVVECYSTTEAEHIEATDMSEDEFIFTVSTLGGSPTFANTSNFVVVLKPKSPLDLAWDELTATIDKYMAYYAETLDESYFKIGTEPGLYGEAEVIAFYDALNKGIAGNVDKSSTEAEIASVKKLTQDILDTYEAVVASKVMTYPVADGYYRFRAAMIYSNEDEDVVKYMMGYNSNGTLCAIWATPDDEDVEDRAMTLWKVTNKDGYFDVQSMYHDGRFNNVSISKTPTMDPASENLMAFDPVTTVDGVTLVNIRVSTQDGADGLYLHQNSHNSGKGTSGYIVGYYSTYNYNTTTPAASEWILEAVPENEAAAIIAAYEPIKARKAFEAEYNQLKTDATAALEKAKDYILTPLITENSQFSSPWTETREGSIDNLIDGNAATYWHSDWSSSVDNHTHYLQVALNEPTNELVRMTITRRAVANDHITLWGVFGSNDPEADDEDWEELASLETPFGSNTETISTSLFDTKGYEHLRFYIDGTTTGRGYGHVSEFQLYEAKVNPTSQYALMGEASKNLEAVLVNQANKDISDIEEADYNTLKEAYDAFVAKYVDPAELREVLASVENLADGIVVGTQPGFWKDANVGAALAKTVSDAKAYDEAGVYLEETSTRYIQTLRQQADDIMAAAIGIETGKWYRIRFGTETEFETYGWDKEAGAAVVNGDEVETDEALWGKYVAVAAYRTEEGVHYIEPIDGETVRIGQPVFLDADEDIENKDYSLFRFVAVGDSAYALQNKATGLFLKASGTSGGVLLNVQPSLFNVSPIGYGQNIIASRSLTGDVQNNLHAARSFNQLVTWNAYTPGSRSGLYIEEVESVAAGYDGSAYQQDIRVGEFYSFCYPVNIAVADGQMYDVLSISGKEITLQPIEEASAGRPFLYLNGDTDDYDAEAEVAPVTFKHGYEFVTKPQTERPLKGTFISQDLGSGYILPQGNGFVVTNFMSGTIAANTAYIVSDETVTTADEITFVISTDHPDSIAATLSKISQRGAIYTLDGRLIGNGNLNDLRSLGKGVYIINGAKVMVK